MPEEARHVRADIRRDVPDDEFDVHVDAPSFMLVKCHSSSTMFTLFSNVFLCGLSLGCLIMEIIHDLTGTGIADKRFYTSMGLLLLRTAYEFSQIRGGMVHEVEM